MRQQKLLQIKQSLHKQRQLEAAAATASNQQQQESQFKKGKNKGLNLHLYKKKDLKFNHKTMKLKITWLDQKVHLKDPTFPILNSHRRLNSTINRN